MICSEIAAKPAAIVCGNGDYRAEKSVVSVVRAGNTAPACPAARSAAARIDKGARNTLFEILTLKNHSKT